MQPLPEIDEEEVRLEVSRTVVEPLTSAASGARPFQHGVSISATSNAGLAYGAGTEAFRSTYSSTELYNAHRGVEGSEQDAGVGRGMDSQRRPYMGGGGMSDFGSWDGSR
jgi:hypothetical protein